MDLMLKALEYRELILGPTCGDNQETNATSFSQVLHLKHTNSYVHSLGWNYTRIYHDNVYLKLYVNTQQLHEATQIYGRAKT